MVIVVSFCPFVSMEIEFFSATKRRRKKGMTRKRTEVKDCFEAVDFAWNL
jgi:hypothetical protein